MRDWYSIYGAPGPLGATWMTDEQAWNFALYSRHASQVALVLYAADNPIPSPAMTKETDFGLRGLAAGLSWPRPPA